VSEASGNGSEGRGKAPPMRPLPARFYKTVAVSPAGADGLHVLLDGKVLRTPAKGVLAVPTRALAQAIAAEWEAQGERIDPASLPLTRLVNSAIDGVKPREAAVREDIAKYAACDLLCYRASEPELLTLRQAEVWDPILAWTKAEFGASFIVVRGLMPATQPAAAKAALARALADYEAFALAALHVMTTLTGSALLALAHARRRLSIERALAAAHIDEDWQIARWGQDAEAKVRRQRRWAEMQAASRLLVSLSMG
jgi:chaperone required for assembly of F1-ATPase